MSQFHFGSLNIDKSNDFFLQDHPENMFNEASALVTIVADSVK